MLSGIGAVHVLGSTTVHTGRALLLAYHNAITGENIDNLTKDESCNSPLIHASSPPIGEH